MGSANVVADIVRVACATTTGQQVITSTKLQNAGITPKAARLVVVGATVDGTARDHAIVSIGMTDGTRQVCAGFRDRHGVGTTEVNSTISDADLLRIFEIAAETMDGQADFVSFGVGTITIDWVAAPSAAYLLVVEFYGGADLQAHADTFDPSDTNGGTIDVTAPGFEPEIVFTVQINEPIPTAEVNDLQGSLGIVHNDGAGTVINRCFAREFENAATTSLNEARLFADRAWARIETGGGIDFAGRLIDFDAQGFTAITDENEAGAEVAYLALAFGDLDAWLGARDSPTATGQEAVTDPGFRPQIVGLLQSWMDVIDVQVDDDRAGTIAIGWITEQGTEYVQSYASEDGVATTNTQSLSDDTAVRLSQDDGAAGLEAAFVSVDAAGYTLDWTTVDATARKLLVYAVESRSIEPTGIGTGEAFGAHAVAGLVSPIGIPSAEAFGAGTVQGDVQPIGIASAEAFGVPTMVGTIAPGGIASAEAFGAPTMVGITAPAGIASTEAFGAPTMVGIIAPAGVASAEAFGAALMGTLSPGGIASAEAFGAPTMVGVIAPAGVASAEAFGVPAIATIQAIGIGAGEAFGTLTIATVQPGGAPTAESFGSPTMVGVIAPPGIGSGEALGLPAIATIQPGGIAAAEAFGGTAVATMTLGGIASVEALGAPKMVGTITTGGIVTGEALGSPILATAQPGGIVTGEALGTVMVTTVQPGAIPSAEAFGGPSSAVPQPAGITTAEAFGTTRVIRLTAFNALYDPVLELEAEGEP